jgi:hypothetical protein
MNGRTGVPSVSDIDIERPLASKVATPSSSCRYRASVLLSASGQAVFVPAIGPNEISFLSPRGTLGSCCTPPCR